MTDEELEQFNFEVAERAAIIAESEGEIDNIEGIAEEMTRYAWKERKRMYDQGAKFIVSSTVYRTPLSEGEQVTTVTTYDNGTTETKTELVPYPKEIEQNNEQTN
jgi:hypothetical protein